MSSIFSSATTLVNPTSSASSSRSPSGPQIYCTFLGTYSKLQPDVKVLNANGYPSQYVSKGFLSFANPSKEIRVEIPTVAFKVTSMSNSAGKTQPSLAKSSPSETLFSINEHRLADVRDRGHLSKLLEMLIGRRCERPRFCFKEEMVNARPKESSDVDLENQVSVEYQYSTATIISPQDISSRKLSEQEMDRILDRILSHLDSRGVLWTHAGRLNQDEGNELSGSDQKSEGEEEKAKGLKFLVLGAFPKTVISRSKSFNPANSGLSDPLPSDLSQPQDPTLAPFIVDASSISELSLYDNVHIGNSDSKKDKSGQLKSDSLEGHRISFSKEPFRGGAKGFNTPRSSGMGASAHGLSVAKSS